MNPISRVLSRNKKMLISMYVLLAVLYGIWLVGFVAGFWPHIGSFGAITSILICAALHIGIPFIYEAWKKEQISRIEALDWSMPVTKESLGVYFGYKKADEVTAIMQLYAKRIVTFAKVNRKAGNIAQEITDYEAYIDWKRLAECPDLPMSRLYKELYVRLKTKLFQQSRPVSKIYICSVRVLISDICICLARLCDNNLADIIDIKYPCETIDTDFINGKKGWNLFSLFWLCYPLVMIYVCIRFGFLPLFSFFCFAFCGSLVAILKSVPFQNVLLDDCIREYIHLDCKDLPDFAKKLVKIKDADARELTDEECWSFFYAQLTDRAGSERDYELSKAETDFAYQLNRHARPYEVNIALNDKKGYERAQGLYLEERTRISDMERVFLNKAGFSSVYGMLRAYQWQCHLKMPKEPSVSCSSCASCSSD